MTRPHPAWGQPDRGLPTLVTLTSVADVPLLRRSIASLLACNRRRPNMKFFGDSDEAVQALRAAFGSSVPGLNITNWISLLPSLANEGRRFVQTYSATSPWGGFGKKLGVLLATSSEEPVLFSDADVIWSGPLFDDFEEVVKNPDLIYAGRDFRRAYDAAVAQQLGAAQLLHSEPLNSGFVYAPAGQLQRVLDSATLLSVLPFAQEPHVHLEQTLVAYAFWKSGGHFFSDDRVVATLSDDFRLTRQVNANVRHYAGGKHLFWRDV